jgi:hypothetical protein
MYVYTCTSGNIWLICCKCLKLNTHAHTQAHTHKLSLSLPLPLPLTHAHTHLRVLAQALRVDDVFIQRHFQGSNKALLRQIYRIPTQLRFGDVSFNGVPSVGCNGFLDVV